MIVVAARAGSVDRLRFVRLIIEEIKIGGLLMQRSISDGNTDHSAGELTELAVFVRERGGIEIRTDLGPILAIITPFEPSATALNVQTEATRVSSISVFSPFSRRTIEIALPPSVCE